MWQDFDSGEQLEVQEVDGNWVNAVMYTRVEPPTGGVVLWFDDLDVPWPRLPLCKY